MEGNVKTALEIPTWRELSLGPGAKNTSSPSQALADKVSLFEGDITKLKVDAIVNAGCTKFQISTGGG